MTDVNDLFRRPGLPSTKRKLESITHPHRSHKAAKVTPNGDAKGHNHFTDEEQEEDDREAGPVRPSSDGDGEEDAAGDDEDGRFFGGGLDKNTAEVLELIEERENGEIQDEKFDSAWLKRLAANFEKRISRNAELRAKFEDDPQKFMGSEADLDADIKALSILSEHPELYEDFAKLGCANALVSLLSHENTDIAIDAIEIISELTDENVQAEEPLWTSLVEAMLESDLLSLLVQNFDRFDETNESDRSGVYHSLSVLENLASQPRMADRLNGEPKLLEWLLSRIQGKEAPVGQNKQYAAEILAIVLQSSSINRKRFTDLDGVDLLLQLLSAYRKRDPAKDSDEEEFVENLFDSLTCIVDEEQGKRMFVDAEGVELCLIMLREGKMSKPRALRLLDHAVGGQHGQAACAKLVEAAGLKTIFSMFMKNQDNLATEHLLGIVASLLRLLPAESPERIRTLAKFVENGYAKITRLISLRHTYAQKVAAVDRQIATEGAATSAEDQSDSQDERFSRRLDAGLFCLQTIDVILAWLVAEDDGARSKIEECLKEANGAISDITATLSEQLEGMVDVKDEEERTVKDMLFTLAGFLR